MFDAYREKLTNLLVSRTSQARMDEVGFFFEEFKRGIHYVPRAFKIYRLLRFLILLFERGNLFALLLDYFACFRKDGL